jgi:hypothetical protein
MATFEIEHDGRKFRVQAKDQASALQALEIHTGKPPSMLEKAVEPITSYPDTYSRMNREARERMSAGISQMANPDSLTDPKAHGLYDVGKGALDLGLGAMEFVTSPINAAIHTVAGKPIEENVGVPSQYTDFATSLALPIPKKLPRMPRMGEAAGPARVAEGPLGVTLSEGQTTGDLSAIQREQAAVRGQSGAPAQQYAQQFFDQQGREVSAAREDITQNLDPVGGQQLVEGPQGAGELVSQSMQRQAAQQKAGVKQAYDTAKSLPGEIHADAFEGLSPKIKTDLSRRDDPIIIDDKLTPHASQALKEIEKAGKLEIQNLADPRGAPKPTKETKTILSGPGYHIADDVEVPPNIVGVNLQGVDQIRKRLSSIRKDAFASGNGADGRAAKAVLDAFDDHIEQAINSGYFQGDPRAISAWNAARAAHADYMKAFTAGKNDPIGRVVEKIIGKGDNPAAIANDVADFMYGTAGTNPTSLNVGVVNRLKNQLGDRSPEWFAVKQGLFLRLVDAGEGATAFGPGKVAQRLNKFLNTDGKEMASVVFSAAERDMLKQYADLMRALEVPQAGANWSNTATFAQKALDKIGSTTGSTVGAIVGSTLGHGSGLPLGIGEAVGGAVGAGVAKGASMASNAMQARKIARQMPVIGKVMTDYKQAAEAFETSPSARTIARLSLASRNLSTNLKDIGVNFSPDQLLRLIQGPRPAGADEKQN